MTRKTCLVVALLLLLPACKKTVEGETKRWDRSVAEIKELTALYPGFTAPLKEQLKNARAAMEAAKGISDQESAANKMAEANRMLSAGFVGMLSGIDDKTKKIREKIVTATSAAKDDSDREAARQAARDARRVLDKADEVLKKGASDIVSATAVVRRTESDLASAERILDRVIRSAKDKIEAKRAVPAAKSGGGATEPAKGAAPAAATWKCSYCDHVNQASDKKCSNCGAEKP